MRAQMLWWYLHVAFWLNVIGVPIYLLSLAVLDYPRERKVTVGGDALKLVAATVGALWLGWYLYG